MKQEVVIRSSGGVSEGVLARTKSSCVQTHLNNESWVFLCLGGISYILVHAHFLLHCQWETVKNSRALFAVDLHTSWEDTGCCFTNEQIH